MMYFLLLLSFLAGSFASNEDCKDDLKECPELADKAECFKNYKYMLRVCRKSCGVCGNDICDNFHSRCEIWAKRGRCNHPKAHLYMSTWCKKACNFCGVSTAPSGLMKSAQLSSGSCGLKPKVRIVGGTEAPKNAWPWQAMLTTKYGMQFCGGTLIHPMWVLSAAHCLGGKPSEYKIRMGAHYRKKYVGTEQNIDIHKIIMHPDYNKQTFMAFDIALIKLTRPAILNKAVGLACLPSDYIPGFVPGKKCWITGWGLLKSAGSSSNVLMQASVPIKSDADCRKSYPGSIHDSMVCAGLDQGGTDSCQQDSGGPMVCEHSGRFHIEGVISWGKGCASPRKYGVYARVRHARNWILQTMAKN